jgi:uracil-DNA glycosylase
VKDELAQLRRHAAKCTACDLHRHATQTVFGEGAPDARLFLVGEQPGDREDGLYEQLVADLRLAASTTEYQR